jgi:hypothetical protein
VKGTVSGGKICVKAYSVLRMTVLLLPPDGNGPYRVLRAFSQNGVRLLHGSMLDPERAQISCLRAVLDSARGTIFGGDSGLSPEMALDEFRAAVPVRTYAEQGSYFNRVALGEPNVLTRHAVKQLLVTSGTTGPAKYLPVTSVWEKRVSLAQEMWRLGLVKDREAITRGKVLTLVSPAIEGHLPSGLAFGSNTGRMHARQPWMVRLRYPAPPAVHELSDPMVRLYCTLRFALQHSVSSITTANPSTILLMARKLEEWSEFLAKDLTEGTLCHGPAAQLDPSLHRVFGRKTKKCVPPKSWKMAQVWDLASIHCWKGGAASFFLDQFDEALGGEVPVREVGITASEGYFALPLSDDDPGGVAWLGAHLMEFVDTAGKARWAWEVEEGKTYRLIISTTAGLYRYDLGDLVEVVGWAGALPRLRFVRKAEAMLNMTGEKVTQDQVLAAAKIVFGSNSLVGLTARMEAVNPPRVELAVEWLKGQAVDRPGLINEFDRALRKENVEYDSKRKSERLGLPIIQCLASGTYARWHLAKVAAGAPDTQIKDLVIAWKDGEWETLIAASIH